MSLGNERAKKLDYLLIFSSSNLVDFLTRIYYDRTGEWNVNKIKTMLVYVIEQMFYIEFKHDFPYVDIEGRNILEIVDSELTRRQMYYPNANNLIIDILDYRVIIGLRHEASEIHVGFIDRDIYFKVIY